MNDLKRHVWTYYIIWNSLFGAGFLNYITLVLVILFCPSFSDTRHCSEFFVYQPVFVFVFGYLWRY